MDTVQGSSDAQEKPAEGRVSIIADHREKKTDVYGWLRTFSATITDRQLAVADYIASERVGIERKTVSDFLECMMNQRLFRQVEELSASFERPLLIIEGEQRMLFMSRRIHPNAIHGALSSITLDHRVPIIWTHDPKATAAQIYWIAYREQVKEKKGIQIRACKKTKGLGQQQEFLVAGLPNINSKLSRRLLDKFGTVKKVFSASEQHLMKVDGIGDKKAREIWCLLNTKYGEEKEVKQL